MRVCAICKASEARNNNSSYCKKCHNEYQKQYYRRNPQSISNSAITRRASLRGIIQQAKDRPCMDCGKRYPYYVMDFDHVEGNKKFNLAIAVNKIRSVASVEAEMAKCEVVCANCHRERTFNRIAER